MVFALLQVLVAECNGAMPALEIQLCLRWSISHLKAKRRSRYNIIFCVLPLSRSLLPLLDWTTELTRQVDD
jgi:hypothetical protein